MLSYYDVVNKSFQSFSCKIVLELSGAHVLLAQVCNKTTEKSAAADKSSAVAVVLKMSLQKTDEKSVWRESALQRSLHKSFPQHIVPLFGEQDCFFFKKSEKSRARPVKVSLYQNITTTTTTTGSIEKNVIEQIAKFLSDSDLVTNALDDDWSTRKNILSGRFHDFDQNVAAIKSKQKKRKR